MSSGMPLRGDRILRYVNAFCPRCHEPCESAHDVREHLADCAPAAGAWAGLTAGRVH